MEINCIRIQNFRRLKNTQIDFEKDISIFVGANNSGKTSTAYALDMFVNGSKDKFSIYDFNSSCWEEINKIGDDPGKSITDEIELPAIKLDLWFNIQPADIHRVLQILPGLDWADSQVGLRIQFQAKSSVETLNRYIEARTKVASHSSKKKGDKYKPWPKNLIDFIGRDLSQEYEFRYYALDRASFDDQFNENPGFSPIALALDGGKSLVKSLIRIDTLHAQRHLSDQASSARAEDLSKCLGRFYKRNLEKREDDHDALSALYDSEEQLNEHLKKVFDSTLSRIGDLGYPGVSNPQLIIKSALNPTSIMSQDTRVHYSLGSDPGTLTLPDHYNGLGFKNLIYMVVELLDIQARWLEEEEERALLQLVIIEEPEAHLHTQLQQVFIRQILEILEIKGDDANYYKTQLAVTTHSPHILYERGFRHIRYFRREKATGVNQHSVSLNLSQFYNSEPHNDFLERYMKLTHCDLFFADAAILVEGNVERLLLPLMINKCESNLNSSYLSILEVGGAYAYRFKSLIEFLGIPALVITDLDSVEMKVKSKVETDEDDEEEDDSEMEVKTADSGAETPKYRIGKACRPNKEKAITSNRTLVNWLPQKFTILELLSAEGDSIIQKPTEATSATIYMAYQKEVEVDWDGKKEHLAARTLEETFALENAEWCQHEDRKHLGLKFKKRPETIEELAQKIHDRVGSREFNKTGFALAVMGEQTEWKVPLYIQDGLKWLSECLKSSEKTQKTASDSAPEASKQTTKKAKK